MPTIAQRLGVVDPTLLPLLIPQVPAPKVLAPSSTQAAVDSTHVGEAKQLPIDPARPDGSAVVGCKSLFTYPFQSREPRLALQRVDVLDSPETVAKSFLELSPCQPIMHHLVTWQRLRACLQQLLGIFILVGHLKVFGASSGPQQNGLSGI
eukprot:1752505-Amphidinium_carterae.2